MNQNDQNNQKVNNKVNNEDTHNQNPALNTWFNIQNINLNQTSLIKVLFIFYVFAASDTTNNLMSKQMKKFIDDNRYMQHILGFLSMIVLVTLVGGIVDNKSAILYALIGYIWFIFSTKLDIHWNLIILLLLFVGYMIDNSMSVREIDSNNDKNLTDVEKQNILKEDMTYKNVIVGGILIVTLIGTCFYSQKKLEQYGGGYDIFAYILK